ncbi:hypothetical protein HPP92_003192 [Vanilla planifolia]|uniref:DUF4283 domain-containing protein n=1 Tax=Vanilla planifolia TaxID=51239 RepID=A0A835RUE9_VANPL|nr:hypothetical protein HPP92_003192 [Vanilla planifolia]
MLFSMAAVIGTPLKIDTATAAVSWPHIAKVCVELDLTKEHPSRIRISEQTGVESGGYWQSVSYDNKPLYCPLCLTIGHGREGCRNHHPAKTVQSTEKGETPKAPSPRSVCSTPRVRILEKGECSHTKSSPRFGGLAAQPSPALTRVECQPVSRMVESERQDILTPTSKHGVNLSPRKTIKPSLAIQKLESTLQVTQTQLDQNCDPDPILTHSPSSQETSIADAISTNELIPPQFTTAVTPSAYALPSESIPTKQNHGKEQLEVTKDVGTKATLMDFPPLAPLKLKTRRAKNRSQAPISPPCTRSAAGSIPPSTSND